MSDPNNNEDRPKPFNWGKNIEFTKRKPIQRKDKPVWLSGKQNPEQADSQKKDRLMMTASVAVIVAIALSIGLFWYLSPADDSPSSADINSLGNIPIPETTLYDLPPLTVAKNFALTSDIEERLKWARNPEEVRKHLSYYSPDARDTIAHQIIPQGAITIGDLHYAAFHVELPDGSRRFLCVIGTPEGPRVDWDAYARFTTSSWDDILNGKVSQATVRIFPAISNHYLRNFEDREKWLAIELSSPELEISVYGYIDRTSALYEEIRTALQSGALRATLDLKLTPENIQHRQAEIVRFHTLGWVKPDKSISPVPPQSEIENAD